MFGLFSQFRADASFDRPKIVGTTFSQKQCDGLGIPYEEAFEEVLKMGFDTIRLCSYMDEIESPIGFKRLDYLMDRAKELKIPTTLTVGVKSPRAPEIWATKGIKERLSLGDTQGVVIGTDESTVEEVLSNNKKVILKYRDYPNLKVIQVENEHRAMLGFANYHTVSDELVVKEINQARELKRKDQLIAMTSEFSLGDDEGSFRFALMHADKVGLNVYPKVPRKTGGYYEPNGAFWQDLSQRLRAGNNHGKDVYIAEAQAEPWENGNHVHINQRKYESSNPDLAIKLAHKLTGMGFKHIDFWGCEHWVRHIMLGNMEWKEGVVDNYINQAA